MIILISSKQKFTSNDFKQRLILAANNQRKILSSVPGTFFIKTICLKSPLNLRFTLTIHSAKTPLSMNHHSSGVRLMQFCLDIAVLTIARL